VDGILNLDKPIGITSAAAVARVKRLLPRGIRIGHAGTLDPFANGVLLLLIGRATRLCESIMNQPKQYQCTVKFGATTPTDDCESAEIVLPDVQEISPQDIERVLPQFRGTIQQIPPAFSAMKIGGRRAYALARSGKPVSMKPRPVRIDELTLVHYQWPFLKLQIDCGRGTYIRALARDIGAALHVGGYLTQLRRCRVGSFRAESAASLATLTADNLHQHLTPTADIAL
jgi:tRNA pseudouridine55 synthase